MSADNPLYLQISVVSADIVVYQQIICKCRYICISVRQIICIGRYAKKLYRSYSTLSLDIACRRVEIEKSKPRPVKEGGGGGGRRRLRAFPRRCGPENTQTPPGS